MLDKSSLKKKKKLLDKRKESKQEKIKEIKSGVSLRERERRGGKIKEIFFFLKKKRGDKKVNVDGGLNSNKSCYHYKRTEHD